MGTFPSLGKYLAAGAAKFLIHRENKRGGPIGPPLFYLYTKIIPA